MELYEPFVSTAKNIKYSVYVMRDGRPRLIHFGDSRYGQYQDNLGHYSILDHNNQGVRDGAAETLLTGVKVVPETMYLGKSSIGGDIAHIGDWFVFSVFIILYVSLAFLPPPLGDLQAKDKQWVAAFRSEQGSIACMI